MHQRAKEVRKARIQDKNIMNREITVTINELTLPGGDVVCDANFRVHLYIWYINRIPKQEIDSIVYLGQEYKEIVDQMIQDDFDGMADIMFDTAYW
jgi:hypothetical protein